MGDPAPKVVPIGPDHQAFIPAWRQLEPALPSCRGNSVVESDDAHTDDSEWLGVQVWPPPIGNAQSDNAAKKLSGRPGQGRDVDCACARPGSTDCVRCHVGEADEQMKAELGAAYYEWQCPEMGEKYAAHWTQAEEDNFVSTVQWSPRGNYWDLFKKTLPHRKRRERVCYYFNVFVLRRRAVQNRLYPAVEIDSDDDETDLFDLDSEGSEDVFDGTVLSSGELDNGEGALLMEVDSAAENVACSGDLTDSSVHGVETCSSTLRESSHSEHASASVSFEADPTFPCLQNGFKDGPTLRKGEETDMEDSDEEQLVSNKCWERPACDTGLHDIEAHPPLSRILEREGLGDAKLDADASMLDGPLTGMPPIDDYDLGGWPGPLSMHSRKDDDHLISTNHVMKELFGDSDSSDHLW